MSLAHFAGPWQIDWAAYPRVQHLVLAVSEAAFLDMPLDRRSDAFKEMMCLNADTASISVLLKMQSASQLTLPGGNNAPDWLGAQFFAVCRAYYAGYVVAEVSTEPQLAARWEDRWLMLSPSLASLPCETVLMFSVYCVKKGKEGIFGRFVRGTDGETTCLGHVHVSLTDLVRALSVGLVQIYSTQ